MTIRKTSNSVYIQEKNIELTIYKDSYEDHIGVHLNLNLDDATFIIEYTDGFDITQDNIHKLLSELVNKFIEKNQEIGFTPKGLTVNEEQRKITIESEYHQTSILEIKEDLTIKRITINLKRNIKSKNPRNIVIMDRSGVLAWGYFPIFKNLLENLIEKELNELNSNKKLTRKNNF